jgi:hypothetical protein
MKLRITLADGETLRLDLRIDRDEWNRRYRNAIRRGGLIEIENAEGEILGISPQQIKFVQYERDDAAAARGDAIPLRRPRAGGRPSPRERAHGRRSG